MNHPCDRVLEYLKSHEDQHIEELSQLIKTPSISFTPYPPQDVERSADQVQKLMEEVWDPLESTCRHASLSIL